MNIGRILMTVAIAVFTFIPPFPDLGTETHVFHPEWLPHARLHTVWLLGVTSGVGLVALYLLWGPRRDDAFCRNVAGALGVCVYGGFMLSAATMSLYGGGLTDVHGGIEGTLLGIDANLATFSIALIVLIAGWVMAARAPDETQR